MNEYLTYKPSTNENLIGKILLSTHAQPRPQSSTLQLKSVPIY